MPHIRVPHGRLYYETHGQGPAVVLLHGMWSNHRAWKGIVPHLARQYRVILVDHMGHGESDRMEVPYRVSTYASDVACVLGALRVEDAAIAGFSLGALVAQEFYFQRPSHVWALVLIAPPPPYRLTWMAGIRFVSLLERLRITSLKKETIKELRRRYASGTDPGFIRRSLEELSSYDDREFARILRSAWSRTDAGREAGIRVPVLIVVGEKDGIRDHSERMRDTIPGCRLYVVPDCDHAVLFRRPEQVATEIGRFLEETGGVRAGDTDFTKW